MVVVGIVNVNFICKVVWMQEQEVLVVCDFLGLQEQDVKIGSIIVAEEGYDLVEVFKVVFEFGGIVVEVGMYSICKVMVCFLYWECRLVLKYGVLLELAFYIVMAVVEQLRSCWKLCFGEFVVVIVIGYGIKVQGII